MSIVIDKSKCIGCKKVSCLGSLIKTDENGKSVHQISQKLLGLHLPHAASTRLLKITEIRFYDGKITSTIIGISTVEIYNLIGQKS